MRDCDQVLIVFLRREKVQLGGALLDLDASIFNVCHEPIMREIYILNLLFATACVPDRPERLARQIERELRRQPAESVYRHSCVGQY